MPNGILIDGVRRLGATALFLVRLLGQCVPALARPGLIIAQIYNTGARSLIIIMLSGLFVGMVLGAAGLPGCCSVSAPRTCSAAPPRSDCCGSSGR